MANKYYKRVLLPIMVTKGDYCFGNGRCTCEHFSNEGGNLQCDFNIAHNDGTDLKYNQEGMVIKPTHCKNLKEM